MAEVNKRLKVLLGFKLNSEKEDKEVEKRISVQLKVYGYEPIILRRTTKKEIQKFLKETPDCRHAILMENVGMATWSQNELAELEDDREIRIVVVLTAARAKQTEYLTTLYAAGITSAIFEHGRNGVAAEEVVDLLIKPRSRRDARKYYGIDINNIAIRSLTTEMYNGLCTKLMDKQYGVSIMERLLKIAETTNPYQMGDFLRKLPADIITELSRYTEYAQLVSQLKESGIKVSYHKPKKYRSINDDSSYNQSAKEQLMEKNLPAEAFTEKEPEEKRKNKWWSFKAKKSVEEAPDAEKQLQEEISNAADIMEGLGFLDDDFYMQEMTDQVRDPEMHIDLSRLREETPVQEPVGLSASAPEDVDEDGDVEGLFLF